MQTTITIALIVALIFMWYEVSKLKDKVKGIEEEIKALDEYETTRSRFLTGELNKIKTQLITKEVEKLKVGKKISKKK